MKGKKFCFSIVVFCCLLTNVECVKAQKREASKTVSPTPEIATKLEQERIAAENLIFDAQGQQAEIAADALIRIVQSNKIITVQRKIELLEEAFRHASEAQYPIRLGFFGVMDTRSGMLSEALDLELDKLSLQSRVVMAMLPLDKQRAKELFQ